MATIQFLAGNPKKGKSAKKSKPAKKASKKSPSPAQLKARANFIKMVRAKAKASKKAKPMKASKKAIKRVAPKKSHKKAVKKRNPQQYLYHDPNKGKKAEVIEGKWFPTSKEVATTKKRFAGAIASKKKLPKKAQSRLIPEIKALKQTIDANTRKIREAIAEKKDLLSKNYVQHDYRVDKEAEDVEAGYIKSAAQIRKMKDIKGKKKLAAMEKKNKEKNVKKAKIVKAKQARKAKKAKKAQQQKQGVFTVAKKKSKKKSSKKVSKKKVSKRKVSPKKRRKSAKKISAPKKRRKSSKKKSKSFTLIGRGKIKSNPSIAGVTGQSDNMAVAGLAIGGFSYNLFNDLGKRYLPTSVMNVIAMAGPVSGAVIPSAAAAAVLFLASKYPKNAALQQAAKVAKGVIASAVVIAGASVYQVVAQPTVKKFIGLAGDEMYGYDDMSGQSDIEFSGQSDSEFSGQSVSEFSGDDEDEFGEDEY